MDCRGGAGLDGGDRAQIFAGGEAFNHGAVLGDEGEGGAVEFVDEFGDDLPGEIVQRVFVEQADQPVEEIFHVGDATDDLGLRIEDVFVGAQDIKRAGGDGGVVEAEEIIRIGEFANGEYLQIKPGDFALQIVSRESHEDVEIVFIVTPPRIGGEDHPVRDIGPAEDTHETLAAMKDVAIGRIVLGAAEGKDLEIPKLHG